MVHMSLSSQQDWTQPGAFMAGVGGGAGIRAVARDRRPREKEQKAAEAEEKNAEHKIK